MLLRLSSSPPIEKSNRSERDNLLTIVNKIFITKENCSKSKGAEMDTVRKNEILQQFMDFTYLTSVDERRTFLAGHNLLSDAAFDVIQQQESQNRTEYYSEHFNLLSELKRSGMEKLDDFHSVLELQKMFVHFCWGFDTFEERWEYVRQHTALFSEKALTAIERFINDGKKGERLNDGDALAQLRFFRNLLRETHSRGIDVVLQEYGTALQKTIEMMNALLRANNDLQAFQPHLYLSQNKLDTKKCINWMMAVYEDNLNQMKTLESVCMSLGIDNKGPSREMPEEEKLSAWGKKALEVWKKSRPKMYRRLKKSGMLMTAALWAQERTKEQVAAWVRAGWVPEYARDEALRIWILLPSEKEQKELSVDQMPWLDDDAEPAASGKIASLFDDEP